MLGPPDLDRYAPAFAPDVEFVDHRTLGFGSARGAERCCSAFRALLEVADDIAVRVDDILGLEPDALLRRLTTSGTDRAGGGSFERSYLELLEFGADGLLTRVEVFDVDREDEALARFDELTAASPARGAKRPRPIEEYGLPPHRRVRPNAATANAARLDAAVAARDADALPSLLADDAEGVHHPTGAAYRERDALRRLPSLLGAEDVTFVHEPLATLGDSLALCRTSVSFSALARSVLLPKPFRSAPSRARASS